VISKLNVKMLITLCQVKVEVGRATYQTDFVHRLSAEHRSSPVIQAGQDNGVISKNL
jgi:hypothetical protein